MQLLSSGCDVLYSLLYSPNTGLHVEFTSPPPIMEMMTEKHKAVSNALVAKVESDIKVGN